MIDILYPILIIISLMSYLMIKFKFFKLENNNKVIINSKNDGTDIQIGENNEEEYYKINWIYTLLEHFSNLFFPLLVLFLLKSFLYEPFKIPSESMTPNLIIGDYVFVNKFKYNIKLLYTNFIIKNNSVPNVGEVVVFHNPKNSFVYLIKRIIAKEGDHIKYQNGVMTINDKVIEKKINYQTLDSEHNLFWETNNNLIYRIQEDKENIKIINKNDKNRISYGFTYNDLDKKYCTFGLDAIDCIVPNGNYFMMGDNRDNSYDSRFWGFVPSSLIVGKAEYIFLNLENFSRHQAIN